MKSVILFFCITIWYSAPLFSQTVSLPLPDSLSGSEKHYPSKAKHLFKWPAFIIPAAFISYGVDAIKNHPMKGLNNEIRDEIYAEEPHPYFHLDNYLQFAPGTALLALNGLGVKGRHGVIDQAGILLLSNILLSVTVNSIKNTSHQLRPDGSAYSSFPSGHTAEAFAGAELLRMEYKDVSPWYGVAGYAAAATTGYLRMYNNRHWFSDVVAGAGVGIASAKIAYWLYPVLKNAFLKSRLKHTVVIPSYQNRAILLNLVRNF
jgi:membrane-associated phospholipid phosphatase